MPNLNEAVGLYLGYGISPYPREDASCLAERFGPQEGALLSRQVGELLKELGEVEVDWDQHSLVTGSESAVEQFLAKHPDLTPSAKVLEWAYSWWWR
jgi:hypothetical protein